MLYCAAIIFTVGILVVIVTWIAKNVYATSTVDWILGWILGTIIAYVVQAALFMIYGTCTYKSFYRKQPAPGNFFSLLWEVSSSISKWMFGWFHLQLLTPRTGHFRLYFCRYTDCLAGIIDFCCCDANDKTNLCCCTRSRQD